MTKRSEDNRPYFYDEDEEYQEKISYFTQPLNLSEVTSSLKNKKIEDGYTQEEIIFLSCFADNYLNKSFIPIQFFSSFLDTIFSNDSVAQKMISKPFIVPIATERYIYKPNNSTKKYTNSIVNLRYVILFEIEEFIVMVSSMYSIRESNNGVVNLNNKPIIRCYLNTDRGSVWRNIFVNIRDINLKQELFNWFFDKDIEMNERVEREFFNALDEYFSIFNKDIVNDCLSTRNSHVFLRKLDSLYGLR